MNGTGGQSLAEQLAAPLPDDRPVAADGRADVRRLAVLAFLWAALYYAAAELGLALRFPGLAVSALWPPNAVLLAALLLTPRRRWWLPLAAIVPAHFAAHADADFPTWRLAWQIGLNWTLAVCTASALRALTGGRHPFGTLRDLSVYLVVAVFAIPALVTLAAPNTVLALLDGSSRELAWLGWRSSYFSNATVFLTLVPAMVLWGGEAESWLRRARPARMVEAGLLALGIYLVCFVVLATPAATPAALYTLLPLLLWAAARFGVRGVASALFVLALGATVCAIEGRGPFSGALGVEKVFELQLFLFAVALPLLILAVLMDERARAAVTIRDADRALRESFSQIQDLAGRLIRAQETERTLIARDLHDDVGQQLAAVAIGLSHARQQLPAGSIGTAAELAQLQDRVDALALAVRDLSHELHPGALRHLGLGVALRGHCREFAERHRIEVDFDTRGTAGAVPPEIGLCLFRVTQEALRNVAQHAGAGRVGVRLTAGDEALALAISDDGRGFDDRRRTVAARGLGLVSLEELVRAVGGRMTVRTRPGEGTVIEVRVPLGGDADGARDGPARG